MLQARASCKCERGLARRQARHTITLPSPFRSVILKAVTRSSPDLSTCSSWRALESPSMLIAGAGPFLSISCIFWLSILIWASSASRGRSNALQCMALDIECKYHKLFEHRLLRAHNLDAGQIDFAIVFRNCLAGGLVSGDLSFAIARARVRTS